jgi:hypothetical protein
MFSIGAEPQRPIVDGTGTGELGSEPLPWRDRIGLTLIFASLCVVSCGAVLFFGSASLHLHGRTGWTGLALILGGAAASTLTIGFLQPHKAAKHASHRLRYHARKLRPTHGEPAQSTTDA